MTTISAKVIAASECLKTGRKIHTLQLRYPRFIHAELMTHRVFSRNASSSRAIPVEKMLETIENDPVVPLYWGKNIPGMQAGEEIDTLVSVPIDYEDVDKATCLPMTGKEAWLEACHQAMTMARAFHNAGYHKQIVNRLLEPFMHIDVLVTSTQWKNFLGLRNHKDAEPHIRDLAIEIERCLIESPTRLLTRLEWHLPYVDPVEKAHDMDAIKVSVARCARVSYSNHDGTFPSIEKDLALYHRLAGGNPLHASPLEHQARPDPENDARGLWGNFRGFIQYRKTVAGENLDDE